MPTQYQLHQKAYDQDDSQRFVFRIQLAKLSEGTRLPVLAEVLPWETTLTLLEEMGGQQVSLPAVQKITGALNTAGAVAAVHEGRMDLALASLQFGVSKQWIRSGLKTLEKFHQERSGRESKVLLSQPQGDSAKTSKD